MSTIKHKELQNAVDFITKSMSNVIMDLDYSVNSIRHLDYILSNAFKKGKLTDPYSKFAQHQGLIILGIAGYISTVILKNAKRSSLHIDQKDEQWYLNFKIIGANGAEFQPGRAIMKRISLEDDKGLYNFALSAIEGCKTDEIEEKTDIISTKDNSSIIEKTLQNNKKPWWKLR